MSDELKAALKRYSREAYVEGHFGDPNYRNVGYLTSGEGWNDRAILSNEFVMQHEEVQRLVMAVRSYLDGTARILDLREALAPFPEQP